MHIPVHISVDFIFGMTNNIYMRIASSARMLFSNCRNITTATNVSQRVFSSTHFMRNESAELNVLFKLIFVVFSFIRFSVAAFFLLLLFGGNIVQTDVRERKREIESGQCAESE